MKKILCLYAHPNPQRSRANRKIVESLTPLANLSFRPLYELYPEFYIDVKREQQLLQEHDLIFFQHPFYWYSMPPLLKLWMDSVLEFDFAYGPKGRALVGKDFLLSITTGGPLDSYAPSGYNRFPLSAFFPPYEQTARLCGMQWHEPLVLHHSTRVSEDTLLQHAESVRQRLVQLSTGAQ